MPSHLADQRSAYLRAARDQPVAWFPWGPEAFAKAQEENKPILLDVGAAWCHWCHVMDHESYEDPAIAEILNREFVCIKVDRDERPDVDARYQRAVQALTGQGGWPLTAFLTPHGEVFYGGTYFPPDGRYGRPGFASLLRQLAEVYRRDPDRVAGEARQVAERVAQAEEASRSGALTPDVLARAADQMARVFDFRYGGFGTQPKFPHPGAVDFLLGRWFDTREAWLLEIVTRTLTGMARGGIRDQLGGGFHRYSVDARWIVPHFEKMLYDNAELLRVYVHGAGAAPAHELFTAVIRDTASWVSTTMADPAGGYYASQDADVGPGDDGDYFTWTREEVRAVLSDDEFEVVTRYYDIEEVGEMHERPDRNALWINQPIERIAAVTGRPAAEVERLIERGRERLRSARARRRAPQVDRTIYTGWSAMTASAMLDAAAFLGRADLERHALTTLERLWAEAAGADGGMRHAIGSDVGGMLEDQVQMAAAALDAYEATGTGAWLHRAEQLMNHVWRSYRTDGGGLRDTAVDRGGEGLLAQPIVPTQDSPTPSPNGVAAITCCRLAEHMGSDAWRARAIELLEALAGSAAELNVFAATLLRAIDWAVSAPTHVVIVGEDDRAGRLHRAARLVFRPRKVIVRLRAGARPATLPAPLRAMIDGAAPRAYVCTGAACAAPVDGADQLADVLRTFGVAG